MRLRSPLGRVLGLGSAKSGYAHWWGQRLSAAALVPLGLWFVFGMLGLSGDEYRTVAAWVGAPMHAILLILFLATLLYHSNLGVQMVVEDYIHHGPTKIVSLVIVKFLHATLAVAGIYAVFSLSFAGQA